MLRSIMFEIKKFILFCLTIFLSIYGLLDILMSVSFHIYPTIKSPEGFVVTPKKNIKNQ